MIINKWKFNGKDVVSEWITSNDYKKFKPITQVYGVCFNKNGKVLVVKDLKDWKIPGGTPEEKETPEETLKREVLEEATVVLGECSMIGCQKNNMDGKLLYQLRYAAKIEEIKKLKPDTATGRLMKRKFIEANEFEDYVQWGDVGKEMFRLACEWYKSKGV